MNVTTFDSKQLAVSRNIRAGHASQAAEPQAFRQPFAVGRLLKGAAWNGRTAHTKGERHGRKAST